MVFIRSVIIRFVFVLKFLDEDFKSVFYVNMGLECYIVEVFV